MKCDRIFILRNFIETEHNMKIDFLDKKEQIALSLENMFNKFGFAKYKMNKFEKYSFYMENEKFLDDSRILTFSGPNGKLLALKPDITMSIVKSCLKEADKNHKIYYNESVFRIPKNDDEFKEIQQIGAEYIGTIDTYQTIEVLNLAIRSLAEISDDFMFCISNVALVLALFDDLNLEMYQRSEIIGFIQQKNRHDLKKFLQQENIESGIFDDLITLSGNPKKAMDTLKTWEKFEKYGETLSEMEKVLDILTKICSEDKISVDFSNISNTEFYNDIVFTGYIKGIALPVLTGGRYDNLVQKMGINGKSALGFAVDLSIFDKMTEANKSDVITVNYDEKSNILELITKANRMLDEGKSFLVKGEKTC